VIPSNLKVGNQQVQLEEDEKDLFAVSATTSLLSQSTLYLA